jgi:tellurite resistance protein TerC
LKTHVKKVLIAIVGTTVLLVGIALLVLPGPAFLVIPAGLAILATEFAWAERWMHRMKAWLHDQREKQRRKKQQRKQLYST